MISGGFRGSQVRFEVISGGFGKYHGFEVIFRGSQRVHPDLKECFRGSQELFSGFLRTPGGFRDISGSLRRGLRAVSGGLKAFQRGSGGSQGGYMGFPERFRGYQEHLRRMAFQVRFRGVLEISNKFKGAT